MSKAVDLLKSEFMDNDCASIHSNRNKGTTAHLVVSDMNGLRCSASLVISNPDGTQEVSSNIFIDEEGQAREGAWEWCKNSLVKNGF